MPSKQTLLGQWYGISLSRIEHHLDNTIDMAIGGRQCTDIKTQAARDR